MSRFDYVRYDDRAAKLQESFKQKFTEMDKEISSLSPSRETSLALTKLEECYMWIGKAIRDDQISRNGKAELQEKRSNS